MEIEVNNNIHPPHPPQEKTVRKPKPKKVVKKEKKKDPPPTIFSDDELQKMIKNIEREMAPLDKRFKFHINKEINRIVIKIIDKKTDKIIKEIPPLEIQHMIAGIRKALGLLVDKEI